MKSQIIFALLLDFTSAQLGDILSYKYQRYSECGSLLSTCQPTISTCAKIVCAECTDLGQTVINNCCSQANPQQCFISRAGSGGNGNPYITTAAPDPNLAACSTALEYITECEAGTPGFSNLANSDEASCLCYDSTTSWDPVAFDNPWSSCIAWAKTADSTAYVGLLSNAGMCASVGNILNAPASVAVTSTTTMGSGAKATVTSTVATPASGSQSVVMATSSTTKSTSSNACSRFTRNIRGVLGVQVVFGLGLGLVL
ncbi:uncharacterized protein K444DRAFT_668421 [Hyaloscypha bicolor E]|uniref:Extracellular membrane protein CFEM domain-containing protein n=1 Tax=Hyaloscypha bicolor E TaxID=1095630 RepID=A0A2J6SPT2_9HELO|nr:uncharacterized protein K444DRAFT_668421 [Hyaloscypha bicolor E]PMD52753.1 hypothetical protein K444DRAFT_668421 [Hyaloscypha bicolor E]